VEVIGRLAGGIVHDFNNLLTIIMGCAEIAAAEVEPTSAVGMELEEIRRVVQTAATLTRQLLMFNHRRAMPPAVIDANRTVGRLTRMIQRVVANASTSSFTRRPRRRRSEWMKCSSSRSF
jgi:signal transduction histidine kinase